MFGMPPSPGPLSTPRHRALPVFPGDEGAVAPSLVWKVCAVLPLLLLVVLMGVKVADGIGDGDDTKESSQSQEPGVVTPSDSATPTAIEGPLTAAEKDGIIKSGAPDPTELPENQVIETTGSAIPDGDFTIPAGPADATATPVPTKKPTKKPTPGQQPSPTPSPSEAREQCIEDGVSVLNIAALAACIADVMDPGN
jgi:hypothetical protein